jgi:signal transduction histidine kinase
MAGRYFRPGFLPKAGLGVITSAVVALSFWYPLRKANRAHIEHITDFAVHSVKTDIADEIRSQLLAQIQLAQLYGLQGTISKEEWDSYASIFVAHHPGYLALLLTDRNLHTSLTFMLPGADRRLEAIFAPNSPLRTTLQKDPQRRDALLSPAFILRNDELGHAVVTPIYHDGEHRGFLIAIFDDKEVLEDALADQHGRGYGLALFEDDHLLYRLPKDYSENEERWGQDTELSLSGIKWRVRVWPQAILLGKVEPRLPGLALITGGVIGFLFSTTLVFAWTAYIKSTELGRARDELEFRVQERTAELKTLNRTLEGEVRERTLAEQSLQDLSGRLLHVRDEEQKRLARELHDSTGQIIGALTLNLERLQFAIANGSLKKATALLSQTSELADRATADLRTISHLLHPPILDDFGLDGAMPWYTRGFSSRSGIKVKLQIQPELGRLPQELELTVFRIVQEALTNIYKHSGSMTADVKVFRAEADVTVEVSDHGCGIAPSILERNSSSQAMVGIGIAGMRERIRQLKGQMKIESDGTGTRIKVVLPVMALALREPETYSDIVQAS